MSIEQCWALTRELNGCPEAVVPASRFCAQHGRNGGPGPLWVWREPVAGPAIVPSPLVPAPVPVPPPSVKATAPERALVRPPDREPDGDPASGASASVTTAAPDWFLALLQQAMTGVMASEATPLQKASLIARLGPLYLKALRTGEQAKAQQRLAERVAELERLLSPAVGDANPTCRAMTSESAGPARAARPSEGRNERGPKQEIKVGKGEGSRHALPKEGPLVKRASKAGLGVNGKAASRRR